MGNIWGKAKKNEVALGLLVTEIHHKGRLGGLVGSLPLRLKS